MAEAILRHLEVRSAPRTMLQLAEAVHAAEGTMLASADADAVARHASRIAAAFLQWYPGGQMIAWGISYQHLAAARSGGWGPVHRVLKDYRGALWSVGEGISIVQPAGLYLNLFNGQDIIGTAISTSPIRFIFELGTNLKDQHPLDLLAIRYIRSTLTSHYLSPDAARPNTITDHLVRLENFRTKDITE
jgi:hypothetical protein